MHSIEHSTPHKAAKKSNKTPNLSLYSCNNIRNVEIFTPVCNTIFSYYYFQFHREGNN